MSFKIFFFLGGSVMSFKITNKIEQSNVIEIGKLSKGQHHSKFLHIRD